jgi:serine/threonine protein kinase
VDARTDLYAVGAVLFECVTGQVVFNRPSMAELGPMHLRESPRDPSTLNPEVSPEFSRIILRALARQPEDRWQSAGALLHALEAV